MAAHYIHLMPAPFRHLQKNIISSRDGAWKEKLGGTKVDKMPASEAIPWVPEFLALVPRVAKQAKVLHTTPF